MTPQDMDALAEKIDQNLFQYPASNFDKILLSNENMVGKFLSLIQDDHCSHV
ncbi:hypothetical protein [Acinetobacter sp. A3]|uniref:hypothetical protein n=1 Tax=Acinetobacter sp. A3 TaxID=2725492 RepID=UPI00144540CE|nr:hypothetical protein [Acinetobacter sp. A3]